MSAKLLTSGTRGLTRPFMRMAAGAGLLLVATIMPVAANAAVLQVDGSGQLTGATGVDVGGTLWDVQFSDGAYDHTSGTGFPASSKPEADLFSQALLDQVLLDTPQGSFDSDPELVQGCDNLNVCIFFTVYDVDLASFAAFYSLAYNRRAGAVNGPDFVQDIPGGTNASGTFATGTETWVMGIWTPSSSAPPPPGEIPVPPALFLMGFGLLGLRAAVRTKPSSAK